METRTLEELKNPEYNYYLAYVIDPAEKDTKKIETAMAQRKNTFAQGNPVQRRLKDLYTEAVRIMTNKTDRENEFQVAKKFKLETAKEMIVPIVNMRRVIYKSDLKKAADASVKWLTVDEIEKEIAYLQQKGTKIVDDTKVLDFLAYDKIEKLLKIIGKNGLYDLLGVEHSASVSTLQNAITTTYRTAGGKTDPKSTAINQICGEAKKIFKDDDSKKNYEMYLATKYIWAEFALGRNSVPEIKIEVFLDYSEKVKKDLASYDVNLDDIEVLLTNGLKYFHIAVIGWEGMWIDLENCPYPDCGMVYVNNDNPKTCPHCHKPLEIICWNCGGRVPYTVKNNTCQACGATKDQEDAQREKERAQIQKREFLLDMVYSLFGCILAGVLLAIFVILCSLYKAYGMMSIVLLLCYTFGLVGFFIYLIYGLIHDNNSKFFEFISKLIETPLYGWREDLWNAFRFILFVIIFIIIFTVALVFFPSIKPSNNNQSIQLDFNDVAVYINRGLWCGNKCDNDQSTVNYMKNDAKSRVWLSENMEKTKKSFIGKANTLLMISFNGNKKEIEILKEDKEIWKS